MNDGRRCDGGLQEYDDRGGGCADPVRHGDVELHKGGYWDVSLCTGVVGSSGVGSSIVEGGTGGVGSGSGRSVGSGGSDSDSGGSIGGS